MYQDQDAIQASLLDRLIDQNPERSRDQQDEGYQSIEELHESVRQDLERLFNTRLRCASTPAEFKQLEQSVVNYGLPDLASINMINREVRQQFCKTLEDIVRRFEPRIKQVKIKALQYSQRKDRLIRFRIDATLHANPVPETIVFDSALEPVTRSVNVSEVTHV